MQIDGAGTDGASAGQRDVGAATPGNERPQNQRGGPHGFDQIIRCFGSGERARANRCPVMGASVAEFDFGAHGGEQLAKGLDVAHLRDVFENHRFVGEQGCRHAGECGVLRATDSHRAEQRVATADYELIHSLSGSLKNWSVDLILTMISRWRRLEMSSGVSFETAKKLTTRDTERHREKRRLATWALPPLSLCALAPGNLSGQRLPEPA